METQVHFEILKRYYLRYRIFLLSYLKWNHFLGHNCYLVGAQLYPPRYWSYPGREIINYVVCLPSCLSRGKKTVGAASLDVKAIIPRSTHPVTVKLTCGERYDTHCLQSTSRGARCTKYKYDTLQDMAHCTQDSVWSCTWSCRERYDTQCTQWSMQSTAHSFSHILSSNMQ